MKSGGGCRDSLWGGGREAPVVASGGPFPHGVRTRAVAEPSRGRSKKGDERARRRGRKEAGGSRAVGAAG
jgi:hypothetical protein